MGEERVNLDAPRYDQSTYWGRATHFFMTTNPLNLFTSPAALERSKDIVSRHRKVCQNDIGFFHIIHMVSNAKKGEDTGLSVDELWQQKSLYDSAFHPDSGDKTIWFGRMSAQVPMNMTITGCMLTFYKTTPQVVFWQWFNQSFNAVVNYSNRSGSTPISPSTLGMYICCVNTTIHTILTTTLNTFKATSYVGATGGALATALGLNAMVKNLPPVVGRLVPFVAVCAANAVNIPMMRRLELSDGIEMTTDEGKSVGKSQIAARQGISMVVLSRVGMAAPGMVGIPFLMNYLERKGTLAKFPRISAPLQVSTHFNVIIDMTAVLQSACICTSCRLGFVVLY